MIKKQSVAALVLLLLVPVVLVLGGMLFNLIDPEMAAGHPNYARNYHLLSLLRIMFLWASLAGVAVLWMVGCLLVIRSKKQSKLWLFLAALGPIGFAILSMLNDRAPAGTNSYGRFVGKMNWFVRVTYELCTFVVVWVVAYEAMVLNRTLMIWYESITTGVSTAQIIQVQNASSGMWAFGEGMKVMFFVVLLYLLRPIVFGMVGHVAAKMASTKVG
ncbi:MAG: hypothetical protein WBQ94_21050 [Terracidiphilus sp.]